MDRARQVARIGRRDVGIARARLAGRAVAALMLDREGTSVLAQIVRHLVIGTAHVDKAGIATLLGHLAGQQHGVGRRPLHETVVGVPAQLAVARLALGDTALDDVRDHAQLWKFDRGHLSGPGVRLGRHDLAQAMAAGHVVGIAELGAAQAQHQMQAQRLAQANERRLVEVADIDALHIGAERGSGRSDLNILRHPCFSLADGSMIGGTASARQPAPHQLF
jgi:hypothetical protein